MVMVKRRATLGGLVGVLLLAWAGASLAAGSAQSYSVPLTRVYAHHACADPTTMPGMRVADTQGQADHLWALCRGRLVLGGSSEKPPPLDFEEERLVFIHMGVRRTGGYRLDLVSENASLVDKTLVIPVIWAEPAKGAMVTQMLTHPCLLLAVPHGTYEYERIEVVDEQGQVRLSKNLPTSTP